MSKVKVLGTWASPFVMRVRFALHLKSVNYELIEENLLEPKSQLLLKSNPTHKKIPVFFHGDKIISESLIILQYIDEVWTSTPSLLPYDPFQRAESRFWAAYINDKFFPALIRALVGPSEEGKRASLAIVEQGMVTLEEVFKKLSKGKAYFSGDNIGYLDIAMGGMIMWIKAIENLNETRLFSEAKTPCLIEWSDRFSGHGAVNGILPEVDKLSDFGLKLRAKILKDLAKTN